MRALQWALMLGVSGVFLGAALGTEKDAGQEQVVQVTARRFTFTPDEIVVQRGRPVLLEIASEDFVHGLNVPALKFRADLPPGQVTRVHFTPERAGEYPFLCDNFCGAGHEEMQGRIVVKE